MKVKSQNNNNPIVIPINNSAPQFIGYTNTNVNANVNANDNANFNVNQQIQQKK